jgi:CheY-like chemotaxis protein
MARILLIDDEPEVQRVTGELLASGGHSVIAPKLDAVMQHLEASDYDLVVTDLRMPGFDGQAVAAWLHANRPGVGAICITGAPLSGDGHWALARSFDLTLAKPFRRAALLRAVDEVIDTTS